MALESQHFSWAREQTYPFMVNDLAFLQLS